MTKKYLYILTLLFLSMSNLGAQDTEQMPNDHLIVQLVTIDPGDELTMWWGHTGIIIHDKRLNSGMFYNYGLFSFDKENFVMNFIRGRLIFWVGGFNSERALNFYKNQNRTIRIQTLNLPPDKKQEMALLLAKNVLPQNREYLYDHYYENCATRLRDLIDKMVNGQFFAAMDTPARMTLRDLTRLHTHRNYFMDWLLMFLMNDSIDQPIRKWDEMFLPTELERNIADFTYVDSEGKTRQLVSETEVYFEAQDVYIVPEYAPVHWPLGLLVSLIYSTILILAAFLLQRNKMIGRVVLSSLLILFALVIGIPGLVLFLMSLFTDHIVTYWNENLFLSNPLTLLLIIPGVKILFGKIIASKRVLWLSIILSGLSLLLIILKILPAFDQDNILSICLILPVLLSITYIWIKILPQSTAE
jgi:hypothetical protein